MTELHGTSLVKELERRFVVSHSRVDLPGGAVAASVGDVGGG